MGIMGGFSAQSQREPIKQSHMGIRQNRGRGRGHCDDELCGGSQGGREGEQAEKGQEGQEGQKEEEKEEQKEEQFARGLQTHSEGAAGTAAESARRGQRLPKG